MRKKWLDGLSDEARNKLSAAEKKFALRYTLLSAVADLSPAASPASRKSPNRAQASLDMEWTRSGLTCGRGRPQKLRRPGRRRGAASGRGRAVSRKHR